MSDTEKCKEKVWNKFYHHQCTKKVWKDGYCKIHHPESVKAREEKSNLRYKQKMDASVYGRLERALKKIEELETENMLLKASLNDVVERHTLYK